MPKIREYTQQLSAVTRPLSQAADPGMAARQGDAKKSIGGAFMQLGDTLFDIAEHNDATTMQVELANARAEYTQKMQRAKETGEAADPEYVQSVQNEAQERAAAIADKMTTRRGADAAKTYGAQFASGMQTMAISDNAAAIGEQAKLRAMESQNINRNTLRSSPDQFQAILGETLNTLDGPAYAHIDAGVREEMKMQAKSGLALATVEGVIHTRSPEEARQILDSGQLDGILTADHKRGLYAEADQAIRAREAEAARLLRQQEVLDAKERETIKDGFIGKMHGPNGNQLSVKEVLGSKLLSNEKEHFIRMMKDGDSAKADPAVVNELFRRIHLPDGDPRKITGDDGLFTYFGRGLDFPALGHLRKELGEVRDPANQPLQDVEKKFMDGNSAKIDKSTLMASDPKGKEQVYKFQQYVAMRKQQKREAGESVFDLYDPRHKDYLGSPEVIGMFQRTPQEQMRDMSDRLRKQKSEIVWPGGAPEARKEGETPEQYLQRMKGAK